MNINIIYINCTETFTKMEDSNININKDKYNNKSNILSEGKLIPNVLLIRYGRDDIHGPVGNQMTSEEFVNQIPTGNEITEDVYWTLPATLKLCFKVEERDDPDYLRETKSHYVKLPTAEEVEQKNMALAKLVKELPTGAELLPANVYWTLPADLKRCFKVVEIGDQFYSECTYFKLPTVEEVALRIMAFEEWVPNLSTGADLPEDQYKALPDHLKMLFKVEERPDPRYPSDTKFHYVKK